MDWINNNWWWCLCCCFVVSANAQTINGSFTHDGVVRQYKIYVPANYSVAAPCPIVFNLHGYGSNATQQAALSEMNDLADTAGCLVVYPEGLPDLGGKQAWNSGYGTSVDDVGFMDRLLDTILRRYRADPGRVYSMGLSNGAIMSHTLACELGNRFAAVGSIAGTMSLLQYNQCGSAAPMPVIHIHGTTDVVVPYAGNTVLIGVNTLVSHWKNRNGISNTVTSTSNFPNISISDLSTAEYVRYENGSLNWVHLIRVNNGGHSWPGSGVLINGNTNMDFSASIEVWKFFRAFRRVLSVDPLPNVVPLEAYVAPNTRTLHWSGTESMDYQLTIYNAYGQLLLEQAGGNDQCALTSLPKGWYVAQWRYGNRYYNHSFALP